MNEIKEKIKILAKKTLEEKWLNENSLLRDECAFCKDAEERRTIENETFCEACIIDHLLCNHDWSKTSLFKVLKETNKIINEDNEMSDEIPIEKLSDTLATRLMVKGLMDLKNHGELQKETQDLIKAFILLYDYYESDFFF